MRKQLAGVLLVAFLVAGIGYQPVQADQQPTHTYVPIGSGYEADTLERFARAAVERDSNGTVNLVVLPITFGTDAFETSNSERKKNLDLAETRRGQVQAACDTVKEVDQTCQAVLASVLIRSDAYLQSNLDLFVADLDGMYILGGDQGIAMQVVENTPLEARMSDAFAAGAVVGGNSAGAAVQSRDMINGYIGNFGPENGFQNGIIDLWLYNGPTDSTRGLSFGISNVIFEQHTYQRGRIGRLINASFTTGLTGIGADAETAAVVEDESVLTDVVGRTSAIVVDLQTYNATGQFAGPTNSLAIHGLVTHLIPPGDFGYDLTHHRPLVDGNPLPAPAINERAFEALTLPSGYGPLILAGDLSGDRSGAVSQRFVALSGGQANARLVVIALGYAKSSDAQASAKAYAAALQPQVNAAVQWFVIDSKTNQAAVQNAIANATGIFVTAPDQSRVLSAFGSVPNITSALRSAWSSGKALLADNAAAAALGQAISIDAPPTSASLEDDSMADFLESGVTIQSGLNWLPGVAVEPRMMPDRHWGRLYNHLYQDNGLLGLGIDVNTAIEITASGPTARGQSIVIVFDGRFASFGLGTNGAIGARYVLLDTYVEGDVITP